MTRMLVLAGDITAMEVDAIVNAANTDLVLGSGVAGAIRTRGGPSIQAECDGLAPVGLGEVAVTCAGDLPARFVIHAAAMRLGGTVEETALRAATRNALAAASERGLRSVAFPAIGTGVGGFSMQRCAEVMLEEAEAHVAAGTSLEEVRFVLFDEPAYRIFEQVRDAARIRELESRRRGREGE